MAAAEIRKVSKSEKNCLASNTQELTPDFDRHVEIAKEHLLMRKFKKCHSECLKGVARGKLFPESPRVQERTEQLCVLCIQALAEMNKWQEVIPLIQNVYGQIEACPHSVIKLCILLYAKVEEYAQCHAVTSIWLRCKDNLVRPGYAEVASLYIEHAMLPQRQILLVPQFLDSCTVLDTQTKTGLVEKFARLSQESQDSDSKDNSELGNSVSHVEGEEADRLNQEETDEQDMLAVVFSHLKAAASQIVSRLTFPSLDVLLKIAAAAVSVLLLIKLSFKGKGVGSVGRITAIWQGIIQTLKSALTPYRMGR